MTNAGDLPTTPGAFDRTYNGLWDNFVLRLELQPEGVSAFGDASPGCAGLLGQSALWIPRVSTPGFTLIGTNVTPGWPALLGLSPSRLTTPIVVGGARLWLNPVSATQVFPVLADAQGEVRVALPIPPDRSLAGVTVFTQFLAPSACVPQGWSASHGLAVTVQR
jgi:hypothetical protein